MTFPLCLWSVIDKRLRFITLLVLDCDGVLTDGTIPRRFSVYDGAGIKGFIDSGKKVIILSGAPWDRNLQERAEKLGIWHVFSGVKDKGLFLEFFLEANNINPEKVLYMGDDLNDLPAFRKAGISVAPKNAVKIIRNEADFVTKKEGGNGAVRELCDLLLKTDGNYKAVKKYIR